MVCASTHRILRRRTRTCQARHRTCLQPPGADPCCLRARHLLVTSAFYWTSRTRTGAAYICHEGWVLNALHPASIASDKTITFNDVSLTLRGLGHTVISASTHCIFPAYSTQRECVPTTPHRPRLVCQASDQSFNILGRLSFFREYPTLSRAYSVLSILRQLALSETNNRRLPHH